MSTKQKGRPKGHVLDTEMGTNIFIQILVNFKEGENPPTSAYDIAKILYGRSITTAGKISFVLKRMEKEGVVHGTSVKKGNRVKFIYFPNFAKLIDVLWPNELFKFSKKEKKILIDFFSNKINYADILGTKNVQAIKSIPSTMVGALGNVSILNFFRIIFTQGSQIILLNKHISANELNRLNAPSFITHFYQELISARFPENILKSLVCDKFPEKIKKNDIIDNLPDKEVNNTEIGQNRMKIP